ncbi:MAG: hypothetical protein R3191_00340, partial [Anaerolineales bacterium]|nr:hypothetical protein [Anaerolineales bacterium]
MTVIGVGGGVIAFRSHLKQMVYSWASVDLGYSEALSQTGRLRTDAPVALSNWIEANLSSDAALPTVALDIKFRHLMHLRAQRERAVAAGLLVQGEDDYVPATMRLDDRAVRVKLRLKGDMTDQFDHGRWAFRVHVKDGNHVFGMRRFSVHHPQVRDYHTEALFLKNMRSAGILAPRYRFIELLLNGENLGIMAVEEHFSTELLELQGRRESVIMKLVESRYWESGEDPVARKASPFVSFFTADFVPFRESKVLESPTLSRDLGVATSLYRGVLEGTLRPSEAFDPKLWGRFFAIVDSWMAGHAAGYINLRFYYNPVTAKLEPVAYDAELVRNPGFLDRQASVAEMLLADSAISREYVNHLQELSTRTVDDALLEELHAYQNSVRATLHRRLPFLPNVDLGSLSLHADSALSLVQSDGRKVAHFESPVLAADRMWPASISLSVYRIRDPRGASVQLRNLVPYEMAARLAVTGASGSTVFHDLTLPATPFRTLPEVHSVDLPRAVTFDSVLVYRPGGTDSAWVEPLDYYRAATSTPIPEGSLESLRRNPFLRFDPEKGVVSARAGSWDVTGGISLPEGVTLVLEPGTELRFEPDAYVVVRGDTR